MMNVLASLMRARHPRILSYFKLPEMSFRMLAKMPVPLRPCAWSTWPFLDNSLWSRTVSMPSQKWRTLLKDRLYLREISTECNTLVLASLELCQTWRPDYKTTSRRLVILATCRLVIVSNTLCTENLRLKLRWAWSRDNVNCAFYITYCIIPLPRISIKIFAHFQNSKAVQSPRTQSQVQILNALRIPKRCSMDL